MAFVYEGDIAEKWIVGIDDNNVGLLVPAPCAVVHANGGPRLLVSTELRKSPNTVKKIARGVSDWSFAIGRVLMSVAAGL